MFERVLFCIPKSPNQYGYPTYPHIGIGYLSEYLEENGIQVEVLDLRLDYTFKDVKKKISEFHPDLVGVTIMSYYHSLAYDLVNYLKQSGCSVVVGGPHVSTIKKQVLYECSADYAIKHEAELAMLQLCKGDKFNEIKGLMYREDDKVIENEDRPPSSDLDNIPFPKYEKFQLKKYSSRRMPIITSRGCPFHCNYCPVTVTMGRNFRPRGAENVLQELEYWHDKGYRDFAIQDDCLTFDKKRIYQFCDLLGKSHRKYNIMCGNGIRADLADEDILRTMFRSGFTEIAFGVESATPQVLKNVKKGETIEKIENMIKISCEIGYNVILYFIVGLPGETKESLKNSINLACKYPISVAHFYNPIPFPGTEMFDWVTRNNFFIGNSKNYLNRIAHWENEPIFETPDFTLDERRNALIETKAVTRAIMKKGFKRRFKKLAVLADIVYFGPFYYALFHIMKRNRLFKKNLILALNKLNITFYI
ncbi:MAG: radical SAM protein [Candidatus Omnitrophica bacterium]|nr:radical SAM protein [Candidatus Omnitrophota bacterium]